MNRIYRNANDPYLWFIDGIGTISFSWGEFQPLGWQYGSQWLTVQRTGTNRIGELPVIDLGGHVPDPGPDRDFRLEDRVTFDVNGTQRVTLREVEYVDSSLPTETHLRHTGHYGFASDGSLDSIRADVGNHEMHFTTAIKDSSLFLGDGYDIVHLEDHLDLPGVQYWSLIRREGNMLDAYSLMTGRRIRMEDGLESLIGDVGVRNFGEVEQLIAQSADPSDPAGPTVVFNPGSRLPANLPNPGDRGLATNIDLRTVEMVASGGGYVATAQAFSDSFNLAYFNFIRYTSENVWVGEATIHNGTIYSTPSDRTVTAAKAIYLNSGYSVNAPIPEGQLSVIGQSRNGTHDLIVAEQATAIDGKLRVYTFNVQSGLYNEFNRVYLGDTVGRDVNMSNMGATFADRVALYGFGGNDTLTAGSGRDYVFGGLSTYNTVAEDGLTIVAASGNIVTGGANADYFGVGATDERGRLIDGAKAIIGAAGLPIGSPQGFFTGSASTGGLDGKGTGQFWVSHATDVITDWQAGVDTLVVLENGVAIIGGLREASGFENPLSLAGNNTIDLRATSAIATSDQNFTGARGGDGWDAAADGTLPVGAPSGKSTLQHIFENQHTRDAASITNQGDVTVVNNGLIVIRGLEGNDTIYGSPGNDYIYGNRANNFIDLGSVGGGGSDRVYNDTFDGSAAKHFVQGFTVFDTATPNPTVADKFFVNKRVIDAFYNAGKTRDLNPDDVPGTYTQAQAYNSRINFLHDAFYNPSFVAPNSQHISADGQAPSVIQGSDGTTFGIGAGLVATGFAMLFIPFVGAAIAKALFATGVVLGAGTMIGSAVLPTDPHLNATYSGDVSSYLNVLTGAGLTKPNTSGNTGLNTSVRFHDFFPGVNANDGYLPVVEFTGTTSNGLSGGPIYGFFAVHSSHHTFVYLVASRDNLVENSEALLVAQINGNLRAVDFGIYDGSVDIYNSDAPPEPAVVLVDPDINAVRDSRATPDYGFREPVAAHPADNDLKIVASATASLAKIVVTGSVAVPENGTALSASQLRVYDGTTKIYDGNPATAVAATFSISETGGVIDDITVSNAGEGLADGSYKNVAVVAGGGAGSIINLTIRGGGVVASSVQIVNGGTGYSDGTASFAIGTGVGQVSQFVNLGIVSPITDNNFTFTDNRALGTIARQSDTLDINDDNNFTLTSSRAAYTVERVDPLTSLVTRDSVSVIEISGGSATIDGGNGTDTLTITSQSDADFLTGAGNSQVDSMESLIVTASTPVTLSLHQQQEGFTITLSQNGDIVTGGQAGNNFIGGAGNDLITGLQGNDTFNGFTTDDTLVGGTGDDKLQLFGTNSALNGLAVSAASDDKIREIEIVELIISERQPLFSVTTGTNGAITEVRLADPGAGLATGVYTRDLVGTGGASGTLARIQFEVVNGSVKTVNGSINATVSAPLPMTTTSTLVSAGGTILLVGSGYSASGTYTVDAAVALLGVGGEVNLSSQSDGFTILGSQYDDTITGSSGEDVITGGAGNDRLIGGVGNDIFIIEASAHHGAGETITGGAGTDTIRFTSTTANETLTLSQHVTDTDNVINVTVGDAQGITTGTTSLDVTAAAIQGSLAVNLVGNDGANVLTGTGNADTINGGAGNDTITGGAGADTLIGGAGNDVYVYTGTGDVAAGETITELAGGGTDRIQVTGSTNFSAMAAANFDEIEELEITGAFTATFTGAQLNGESISLIGASGVQAVVVNVAAGETVSFSGISVGTNWTAGEDTFTINGNTGAENITGTAAGDIITGGAGVDTLTGGGGADIFVFSSGATGTTLATADLITDFATGVDKIKIGFALPTISNYIEIDAETMDFDDVVTHFMGNPATTDKVHVYYNFLNFGDALVLVNHEPNILFTPGDTLILLQGISTADLIAQTDFIV